MLARHVHGTYCGAPYFWFDRTQGAVPVTTQTHCSLRHTCPIVHFGRSGSCCNRVGSRSRAGPNEPQATAEATPVCVPPEAPSTSDQSRQSGHLGSTGANNKAAVALTLVSAALWQPSSVNPLRAEAAKVVQANEYNRAGSNGGRPLEFKRSAAANAYSAEPDVAASPQTDDNQKFPSSRGKPSRAAMSSSNLPPGQSSLSQEEVGGEGRTPSIVQTVESSAPSALGAASQMIRKSGADQLANGDDIGLMTGRHAADADGLPLPGNAAELSAASGIESLVANALEFDEAAFQGGTWGDMDWDLEDLRPLDYTAASTPSGSSRVGAALGSSINGAGAGRRNRHGGGGGNRLDDKEGTWDFETYGYGDDSDDNTAAAIAPGTAWSRYRDDKDAGSPGDFRPQRRGRGDRGSRGRDIRRWWQGDWENNDEFGYGGRQDGVTQVWVQGREPDVGLDVGKWEVKNLDDFRNPDEDRAAPSCGIGDAGDIGRGCLGGGGRKAAIASESKLRRAVAAVSTRLPRRGLSVTFPLPPASCAAPEAKPAPASAPPAQVAPMPTPASEPPVVGQSEGAAQQEASMTLSPATSAQPSGTTAAAPTMSSTPAAAAAASTKAAAGDSHDWATVPLSYNFGPSFKLLEESAVPREAPLPEDLLALAGRLTDGRGGGGRSAVDALLPGCTAYTIAGDYKVLLVQDARSVDPAVAWLRASIGEDGVVGIDAEWPPTFKSGMPAQLAVLQVASPSRVLLLHVAQMRHKALAAGGTIHTLLSDASLTWVGCGWSNSDRHVITEAFGGTTLPAAVVDVQVAARAAGWPRVGLLGLVKDMLGVQEFQKPRKLSMCNWAATSMSTRQVRYAALDALLPPILLKQLRLFAAMPALRCSFCKQPMHAPRQHDPVQPVPTVLQNIPSVVCDHCGRIVRRSTADRGSCHEPVAGAQAEDISRQARTLASGSPPTPKAASKAGSLRTYLQSVVDGRQKTQGLQGRRSRQSLFSDGSDAGSDSDPGSDLDSGSDGEVQHSNASGEVGAEGVAGKGKTRRKKKRTVRPAVENDGAAPSSSRQQALREAFEEASPAAAAAVALAMAGQDGSHDGATSGREQQTC